MRKGLCILLTILFMVAVASAEDNVLGLQDNGIRLITYNNSDEYRFGIINQYGDDLGINYPYIGRFLDGYAVFADDHGRVGVLNTKGETVIQPAYDYVAYLKNGVFWATDEHGLYLLNVSGEIVAFIQNAVVKCGYDDYIIFYGDRGMGVLLSDGEIFLEAEYEEIDLFSCGIIMVYQDNATYYINTGGEIICQCSIGNRFNENLATAEKDGQNIIIDTDGNILYISDGQKWFNGEFYNGVCLAVDHKTGKYGYINRDGDWVIDPDYDHAYDFQDGYASVKMGDKYGVIDLSGEIVVDCVFDSTHPGEQGFVTVGLNEKYGLVNTAGSIISEPVWDNMSMFMSGRCFGKKDGLVGIIDSEGNEITDCRFKMVERFVDGLARVKDTEDKWWYINLNGDIIAPAPATVISLWD